MDIARFAAKLFISYKGAGLGVASVLALLLAVCWKRPAPGLVADLNTQPPDPGGTYCD